MSHTSLSLQRYFQTICVLKYCRKVGKFYKPKIVSKIIGHWVFLLSKENLQLLLQLKHLFLKFSPLDNHCTSAWCNLIASASMSLRSSENIRCFIEFEQMKFTIFMTSSRRISRPDRWLFSSINLNTRVFQWIIKQWVETQSRETIFTFRITPLGEAYMTASPSVVTDLHFFQSKPRSSINWLNLAETAWAVAQTTTTFRQYK